MASKQDTIFITEPNNNPQVMPVVSLPTPLDVQVNNFPQAMQTIEVSVTNWPNASHSIIDNWPTPVETIAISNWPNPTTSMSISNIPHVFVDNFPNTVSITNFPASQHITVDNPVTSVIVSNAPHVIIDSFPANQSFAISNIPHVIVDNQINTVSISNFPVSQHVTLDNASINIGNWPTPVTTVGVNNFPNNQNVTVSNIPHVVVDNFPSSVTTVSVGNFPANQTVTVSNSVAVNNFPTTQNVSVANIPHVIVDNTPTKKLWYQCGTAETKVLKTGAGRLYSVIVNKKGLVAAAIAIYDGLSAAGKLITLLDATTSLGVYEYNLDYDTGLTIVATSTISSITVVYD